MALEADLCHCVRDLLQAQALALVGGLRLVLFGGGLFAGALLFWGTAQPLLGQPKAGVCAGRLISWPMAWPFATQCSVTPPASPLERPCPL